MTQLQVNHTAKLFGYIKLLDGTPSIAATVRFILSPSPQIVDSILLDRTYLEILTDEDGYFEQVLPGGIQVTVIIPSTKFQASGLVPLSGELNVTMLDRRP